MRYKGKVALNEGNILWDCTVHKLEQNNASPIKNTGALEISISGKFLGQKWHSVLKYLYLDEITFQLFLNLS